MYRESENDLISTNRTINNLRKTCLARVSSVYKGIDAEKVTDALMKMHGLQPERFDFLKMVDAIAGKGVAINAISIDDNANKSGKNFGSAVQESVAPVRKAIGFDYYYRKTKELYGEAEAKRLFGKILDYTLPLSDETNVYVPYSYYAMTPVMVKFNEKVEIIPLKDLFDRYRHFAEKLNEEAWQIDATKLQNKVDFVAYQVSGGINSKRSTYRQAKESVTEDVDAKIWDSEKGWVQLRAITKHKNHTGFTVYQTNRGDYAFVTDDHPVILADSSEKNAAELESGDEILKNETIPEFKEFINVPEKLAYILGFIFGDGYCKLLEFEDGVTVEPTGHVRAAKNRGSFAISQKDVENHAVTKHINELFGDCVWGRNKTVGRKDDFQHETFTSHWLAGICSCYFGMTFQENSHTKSLPNNILNWKKEAKEAFVAGLIDADGTVFKDDGRVDIRIKAYGLSVGLYELLRTIDGVKGINKRVTFIKRYKNAGGERGTDRYRANSMLFGTAFKPSRGMRKFCCKLAAMSDEEFEDKCMQFDERCSNERNDKITKIVRFKSDQILSHKFKSELEYVYDVTTETGRFYTNGMVQHNCWSFNASLFVVGGKNFGTYQAPPPESVGEYVGGLSEIVHEFASNLAGALAVGTFFFDIAHLLLLKEGADLRELRSSSWLRKSLTSEYRQFIRSVNNVSRNGIESPFTNISLFDRPKIHSLLEEFDWYFPVNELPISKPESIEKEEEIKIYYRDFLTEYVMELQDLYLDVFDKGDPLRSGAPLTFPVTTLNIAKSEDGSNKIVDLAFLKDVCNREIYRYNIFASKGSKIASCCFRGDQEVTAAISGEESVFEGYSLEELFNKTHKFDEQGNPVECIKTIKVHGEKNKTLEAKVVRIGYTQPFIAIYLSDGSRLVTTDNHKNAYVLSEDYYADVESAEVKPGIAFYVDPEYGENLEVREVNKNVPNMQRVAYCLEIIDRDATHFVMPNGVITHNCRLINDTEMMELASQSNSFGAGGSVSLGSDRVITNNTLLTAIAAESRNDFYRLVAENMEDSAKLLAAHKELIRDLEKVGTQPFISAGWIDLSRMFGTFGIIGTWETAEVFRQKFSQPGQEEDVEANLLRFINSQMELVCKKFGVIGNIEQIPGESMAHRLCNSIKLLFPECEYMKDRHLISNQLIPLWEEDYSVWDRMDNYGRYDKLITGGGILHLTVSEKITPAQNEKLIRYAVKSGAEHLALNPTICICSNSHQNIGDYETCPECGEPIHSHVSRIIGYFRPIENWSPSRQKYDAPLRHKYDKSDF